VLHYYLTWVAGDLCAFREKFNFFCKFYKQKDLVCMKAVPTSNFRNTWSVKVVNHLILVIRTCKTPLGSLVTNLVV